MREMMLAFGCVLLVAGLAGCIGGEEPDARSASVDEATNATTPMAERANVTQIPAELAEIRLFNVTADDGVTLRGHVYLPEGSGPFAPVLHLTPYPNSLLLSWDSSELATEEGGRRTMGGFFGELLDAGFAVAIVNVRGTGASDGCLRYGGPQAIEDAGLVVQALAEASWSNGRVGMLGSSYPGKTQYMAIASGVEPLDAVVAVSAIQDHWNYQTYHGASRSEPSTMARYIPIRSVGSSVAPDGSGPTTQPARAGCPAYAEDSMSLAEAQVVGDDNEWLDARDYREEINETDVPMLVTNGLEIGEGPGLSQVNGLWQRIPHEDKRLIVGQWDHAYPFEDPTSFVVQEAVPWLDHYLRQGPPTRQAGTVTYEDSSGTVHNTTAWPPANETLTPLFLSDHSLVLDRDGVQVSEQRFVTNDRRPSYPRDSETCPGLEAVYSSPPLAEEVLVAGHFFSNVTLTSSQPDENVHVSLWTGEALRPCTRTVLERENVRHGWALSDLYHRGHLEQGEAFPVDETGEMEMTSVPLAEVLPAGSRIMLAVGAGHPFVQPTGAESMLTVQTGPDTLGELWLPVVEGELTFDEGGDETSASGSRLAE